MPSACTKVGLILFAATSVAIASGTFQKGSTGQRTKSLPTESQTNCRLPIRSVFVRLGDVTATGNPNLFPEDETIVGAARKMVDRLKSPVETLTRPEKNGTILEIGLNAFASKETSDVIYNITVSVKRTAIVVGDVRPCEVAVFTTSQVGRAPKSSSSEIIERELANALVPAQKYIDSVNAEK